MSEPQVLGIEDGAIVLRLGADRGEFGAIEAVVDEGRIVGRVVAHRREGGELRASIPLPADLHDGRVRFIEVRGAQGEMLPGAPVLWDGGLFELEPEPVAEPDIPLEPESHPATGAREREVACPGYLDAAAVEILKSLPFEHLAIEAGRMRPERSLSRFVNRLRRERLLFGEQAAGFAGLALLPGPGSAERTEAAWGLQSHPSTTLADCRGDTDQLRALAAACGFVFLTRAGDLLHPSAAAILARQPGNPDVMGWDRFVAAEARAGAPGTVFRRPAPRAVDAWHGAVTDSTLAVRGSLIAEAPQTVLEALAGGRLHPLFVWLAGRGAAWVGHPEALTSCLEAWSPVDRAEVETDLALCEELLNTAALDATLVRLPESEPFPYVLLPARRAASISVLISFRNHAATTARCLESIAGQHLTGDLEIVLVDNQSAEVEAEAVRRIAVALFGTDRVKSLRYDRPFNHSAQNNLAAEAATGEALIVCNNDVRLVSPGALEQMAAWALQPGIGAVGCRLVNEGREQGSFGHAFSRRTERFAAPLAEEDDPTFGRHVHSCAGATLALAAIARDTFQRLGGLDEVRFPIGYNDVDFMLRSAREGLVHLYLGHVGAVHARGSSRSADNEDLQGLWLRQQYADESSAIGRQLGREDVGAAPTARRSTTAAAPDTSVLLRGLARERLGHAAAEERRAELVGILRELSAGVDTEGQAALERAIALALED